MNRRHVALGGIGLAAAAAGVGWRLWTDMASPRLDAEFWAQRFPRPEGGELALADFRGKPLLMNFWATWCPPCIRELPEIDRFHARYQAAGFRVVGLAVDAPAPVRQFLAKQPLGFAVGLAGLEGTELTRRLGNTSAALPFSVWIDGEGSVRHRKLGQTSYDELVRWAGV